MARHYYAVMHRESRKMLLSARYYGCTNKNYVRFGDPADTSASDWQQWQVAVWTSQKAASEAAAIFSDELTITVPVRVMDAGTPPQKA